MVTYNLYIDNKPIPEVFEILDIHVAHEAWKVSKAMVKLKCGGFNTSDSFGLLVDEKIDETKTISIGVSDESEEEVIFIGKLHKRRLRLNLKSAHMELELYSTLGSQTKIKRHRVYDQLSLNAIIHKLLHPLKYQLDISEQHVYSYKQNNISNHEMFVKLLKRHNLWYRHEGDFIIVFDLERLDNKVFQVTSGGEITKLYVNEEVGNSEPNQLISNNIFDSKCNKFPEGLENDYKVFLANNLSFEQLKVIKKRSETIERHWQYNGFVEVKGTAQPQLFDKLKIEGYGEYFDRDLLITKVEQHIAKGKWRTMVGFGFQRPSIYSQNLNDYIIGKVSSYEDIAHQGCILKAETAQYGEVEVVMTYPYLGKDSGFCFHPEIGSQILLMSNNDIDYQFICIGVLPDHLNNLPYQLDTSNNEKLIKSKEGLFIKVDDHASLLKLGYKDELSFELDGKNQVLRTQNATSAISLNNQGVKVESKESMDISCKRAIEMKSESNMKIDIEKKLKINSKESKVSVRDTMVYEATNIQSKAGKNNVLKGQMIKLN